MTGEPSHYEPDPEVGLILAEMRLESCRRAARGRGSIPVGWQGCGPGRRRGRFPHEDPHHTGFDPTGDNHDDVH